MSERPAFLMYRHQAKIFLQLSVVQRGELITDIINYYLTGEYPVKRSKVLMMAFTVITEQMDYDAQKYETKCMRMADNARKRWAKKTEDLPNDADECNCIGKNATAGNTNINSESNTNSNSKTNSKTNQNQNQGERERERERETEAPQKTAADTENTKSFDYYKGKLEETKIFLSDWREKHKDSKS